MPSRFKPSFQDKPGMNPRLISNTVYLREKFRDLVHLVHFHWPLVLSVMTGIFAAVYTLDPLPPHRVRLATGQAGSSLDTLGQKFKVHFARHGITLDLVNTNGAFENVELLRTGKVDAAFSLGGMINEEGSALRLLGAVEYQPIWVFYRGLNADDVFPGDFFKSRTLSINIPGSSTRSMSEKILALHGVQMEGNPHLIELNTSESVAALREKRIDGMFLVAAVDAPNIRHLLEDPDIQILDLVYAETYRTRMRFLEIVTLPRGGLDAARDLPPRPRRMVAATASLLTTNAMHGSVQHLFLDAIQRIDQEGHSFFKRTGGFPARIEGDLPLSHVAERHYTRGPPLLGDHLPFWLADLLVQVGVVTFGLAAIAYPLSKVLPRSRIMAAKEKMDDLYDELRNLDRDLRKQRTPQELTQILARWESLERDLQKMRLPSGTLAYHGQLRIAFNAVREKISKRQPQLQLYRPPSA